MSGSVDAAKLELNFKKWQCLCRQSAMRENMGRPDASFAAELVLEGEREAIGRIVTVMNKREEYSEISELLHIARKTHDPAQVRENAVKYLSATYFQRASEFSDLLTATFPPGSQTAERLEAEGKCRLVFEAYSQRYDLTCTPTRLADEHELYQATIAHNQLFNPNIPEGMIVMAFKPDWENCLHQSPVSA